jgi:hypothetical protein
VVLAFVAPKEIPVRREELWISVLQPDGGRSSRLPGPAPERCAPPSWQSANPAPFLNVITPNATTIFGLVLRLRL